jgi:hypothetical protein
MKSDRIRTIVMVTAALHFAVLSFVFGLRHPGYIVTTILSATLIWGVVRLLKGQKGCMPLIAASAMSVAVQQVAYQAWKTELPGFCWPLAQFVALHFLVAVSLLKTAP